MSIILGLVVLVIYTINNLYLVDAVGALFIKNHLNDVLAGVLLLCYINTLSILCNQPRLIVTRLSTVVLITLASGLFWEYITPLYLDKSVSDHLDVIAYIAGGIIYYTIKESLNVHRRISRQYK